MRRVIFFLFGCLIAMTSTAWAEKQTPASIRQRVNASVNALNKRAAELNATSTRGKARISKKLFDRGFVVGYQAAAFKVSDGHPMSPYAREARQVSAKRGARMTRIWENLTDAHRWARTDNPYLLGFEQGGRMAAYETYVTRWGENYPDEKVPSFKSTFRGYPLKPAVVETPKASHKQAPAPRRGAQTSQGDEIFRDTNRNNGGDI